MLATKSTSDKPREADRTPRAATQRQKLLTLQQVEAEYGIPYRSVYDLFANGALPGVRFKDGGRIWLRREDVDALIERSVEHHELVTP